MRQPIITPIAASLSFATLLTAAKAAELVRYDFASASPNATHVESSFSGTSLTVTNNGNGGFKALSSATLVFRTGLEYFSLRATKQITRLR